MRKGIAVSPGVSIGVAYCIDAIFVGSDTKKLADNEVSAELARYETARDRVTMDLRALEKKVASQVDDESAAIFAMHAAVIRDPSFTNNIRSWIIEERMTAQAAIKRLLDDYTELFSKTKGDYLQERLADIRDVVLRLSGHLSDVLAPDHPAIEGPLIVIADELLPSQVVMLGDIDVRGIVTQTGSQTSHAAIVARSRGIPAVSGVRGILKMVNTGDQVGVDGREGTVIINPNSETLAAFRKLEREFFNLKDRLAENRADAAQTADKEPLELLANINGVADAIDAGKMGASGVGLYRTEYLYLTHPDVPDEQEQVDTYKKIIAAAPNHQLTIRTLDIGGDKTVPYLGHSHQEANPFLGWRSIRLSFEHPEFFNTQIRAVLRAAGEHAEEHPDSPGEVKLMFPMITTLEEVRRVRSMVRRACRQLTGEKRVHREVPIGMMLEVPAAAVTIDNMLDSVDFVSIGSNDLVQYLMAADRDNPKVSHLCQPLSPAVLRVLSSVIRRCRQANVPVTLCGEMAGRPRTFVLLLGMGLTQFSMSPAFIPSLKELASHITLEQARTILQRALLFKTTSEVKRYMQKQVQQIAPNLAVFDIA